MTMPDENEQPTPAPAPALPDDWWQKHLERIAEQHKETAEALKVVLPELAKHGVSTVKLNYSGSGDSGAIDGIAFLRANGEPVPGTVECECAAYNGVIEEFGYAFLEQHHGGWENNDGADGEISIDVAESKATLQHNQHFTDTQSYEHETDI